MFERIGCEIIDIELTSTPCATTSSSINFLCATHFRWCTLNPTRPRHNFRHPRQRNSCLVTEVLTASSWTRGDDFRTTIEDGMVGIVLGMMVGGAVATSDRRVVVAAAPGGARMSMTEADAEVVDACGYAGGDGAYGYNTAAQRVVSVGE